jgi:hypothetical protein
MATSGTRRRLQVTRATHSPDIGHATGGRYANEDNKHSRGYARGDGAIHLCGRGLLLAVLWFDLMFDVQIARSSALDPDEDALGSIAAYYRRVTTTASPMNRLVATAMLATLASIIVQIARGDHPRWIGWAALLLAAGPILLAGLRTVPSAVRLGARTDPTSRQLQLARSIYRDHRLCAASISALLVVELCFA